jgi:hypothetical protein
MAFLAAAAAFAQGQAAIPAQVVRVIADPHSGERWLLLRDAGHPAGPGRLVKAVDRGKVQEGAPIAATPGTNDGLFRLVIRAGDRLVVEENTAVAEARLEAVALGPAAAGAALEVRLRMGGKVVRAVALAPGRAAFASGMEARP